MIRAIECSTATHSSSFPPLRIHTDSTYVKNGIEVWMNNWKRNGWKNKTGQPVANQDLWQQLDALNTRSSSAIQYVYVRGHSGDAGNEAADRLAVQGSEL